MTRWSSSSLSVPALGFALLALALPARAADHYVDVVRGNDANDGATPATAWKTITHAIGVLPHVEGDATEVIHVAPGTYSLASGESFPLRPKRRFQVVGQPGGARPRIDGEGTTSPLFLFALICHLGGNDADPDTRIEGLELVNAGYGVQTQRSCGPQEPTLVNLLVQDMLVAGIAAGDTSAGSSVTWVGLRLQGVEIRRCPIGFQLVNDIDICVGPSYAWLDDCVISECSSIGVHLANGGGGVSFRARRTRVERNAEGVRTEQPLHVGSCTALYLDSTWEDCSISGNATHGLELKPNTFVLASAPTTTTLTRCTIASNGGIGVIAIASGAHGAVPTTLTGCIVHGNADDLIDDPGLPGFVSVSYCDIGDGDFAGANGNFSADPLFRAPAAGDWRLAFGSPCIDAGDPATPLGVLDLARTARPVDGDLDALERADIGALEFTPLEAGPAHVGVPLSLWIWGPAGGGAILAGTRDGLLAVPRSTPFGQFDLGGDVVRLGRYTVGSGPPALVTLPLSSNPGLIGRSISFQARIASTVAVPDAAWSNAATVIVAP